MFNKLKRLYPMSGPERRLIGEAAMFLALARLLILFVPFGRLAPYLSHQPKDCDDQIDPSLPPRVRRAVMTAARNVPWKAVCLPQAMAAKFMLARRGCASRLHLGVGKNEAAALMGHAWLEAGNIVIVGEAGITFVTPVAQFG
jgi:hypothetical protein